jgi:hypothetical protein
MLMDQNALYLFIRGDSEHLTALIILPVVEFRAIAFRHKIVEAKPISILALEANNMVIKAQICWVNKRFLFFFQAVIVNSLTQTSFERFT